MTIPDKAHTTLERPDRVAGSKSWEMQVFDNLHETDLHRVVDFLHQFLPPGIGPGWSSQLFSWKLGEGNPAGRGFLTCAVANDQVVGVVSMTPKRLWFRNAAVLGAEMGDTYTHPKFLRVSALRDTGSRSVSARSPEEQSEVFRTRSIFGQLASETITRGLARGIRIIYGAPNTLARPGWEKRLNFLVHAAHHNYTWVRPTTRGLIGRYRLLRPVSQLLRWGEHGFDRLAHALASRRAGGYELVRLNEPLQALDELWDRVKSRCEFSLLRDRRYFQHRFFDHPFAGYRLDGAFRKGRLCGVVVSRVMSAYGGKRYCCIADWLTDETDTSLATLLFAHLVRAYRQMEVDSFVVWSSPDAAARLSLGALGFVRAGEAPVMFYQNPQGCEVLHTCPVLHLPLAASDNV